MILSLVSCCSVSKHTRVSCGEAENSFCVSGRQIMIFIKSDFYKCCESVHEPVIPQLQWATHTHKCVLFPLYCVCCTQAVIESLKSCWLTKTRQTISFSTRKEKKPEEKLRLLFTDVFLKCWSISRSFGSLSALQTSLGTKRAVQTFSWSEADDWQLPNVYLWKHTHTHGRRLLADLSLALQFRDTQAHLFLFTCFHWLSGICQVCGKIETSVFIQLFQRSFLNGSKIVWLEAWS